MIERAACFASLVASLFFLSACTTVVSTVTADFTEGLGESILDNPDLEMVRDGAPTYLLLIDGMLARNPDSADLLMQSARLNSAYAAAFVVDPVRAIYLTGKALDNAQRAVCLDLKNACGLRTRDYAEYEQWLVNLRVKDVPIVYLLGSTWAGWIQASSDDFAAIAEMGRVKALMARVVELDEDYDYGGSHLYLGVFETVLPPSLGGRPEIARAHFERALTISDRRYLMVQVMYADQYARLLFDRELHDALLNEVVTADPDMPGLTLVNTVAQIRAQELLDSADAYF